jgi:hypothetical protein
MKNDENIFVLSNQANYSTKITSMYSDIVLSYCNLINFYVSYAIENMNIKDKEIFFTGLNVIQHVFRLILFYTKNLELTNFNTQQGIYYYVEYISQITDNEDNIFFNLSIKDAVIYVYTRTIFEIKKHFCHPSSEDEMLVFQKVTCATNNYKKVLNLASVDLFECEPKVVKEKLCKLLSTFTNVSYDNNDILDNMYTQGYDTSIQFLESIVK